LYNKAKTMKHNYPVQKPHLTYISMTYGINTCYQSKHADNG